MAIVKSRSELSDYCLRSLGHPLIQVNVHTDQIDDRIDEALDHFRKFHMDGQEHSYYVHPITQEDIDRQYIVLPDNVIDVVRVMSTNSFDFSFKKQHAISLLRYGNVDVLNWYLLNESIDLINGMFSVDNGINFTRKLNKLVVSGFDYTNAVPDETAIVLELYTAVEHDNMFNDMWLKEFTTQLVKRQWGENLKKLKGMKLPGGVEFDGQSIYDESVESIDKLKEELSMKWAEPDEFLIG